MRSPLLESPWLVYRPTPYEFYGGTHRVRAGDQELLMTWGRPTPWFTPWGGATSSWACGGQVAGPGDDVVYEELPGAGPPGRLRLRSQPSWAWEVGRGMLPSELRSWAAYVATQVSGATGRLVGVVLSRRAGWSSRLLRTREAGPWCGRPDPMTKSDPVLYAALLDPAGQGRLVWEALGAAFLTSRPPPAASQGSGGESADYPAVGAVRRVRRSRWRTRW